MVERKSRTELAAALRQLFNFRLTTAEFRDRAAREWFQSPDKAVRTISRFGSSALSADPMFPSWLEKGRLDSIPAYRKAARCIWFLQTDLSYDWPRRPEHKAVGRLGRLLVIIGAVLTVALTIIAVAGWFVGSPLSAMIAAWWTLAAAAATILGWLLLRLWFGVEGKRFERAGDAQVWPFHNRNDYRQARRARAALRNVSDDIE
jgi:small-conductance mechanosensitive channel